MKLSLPLVGLMAMSLVSGLYTDQAGAFDWYEPHTGAPTMMSPIPSSSPSTWVFSTAANTIGALRFDNGQVLWRHTFPSSSPLLAAVYDPPTSSSSSSSSSKGSGLLITLSGPCGRKVQGWNAKTGALVWTSSVPFTASTPRSPSSSSTTTTTSDDKNNNASASSTGSNQAQVLSSLISDGWIVTDMTTAASISTSSSSSSSSSQSSICSDPYIAPLKSSAHGSSAPTITLPDRIIGAGLVLLSPGSVAALGSSAKTVAAFDASSGDVAWSTPTGPGWKAHVIGTDGLGNALLGGKASFDHQLLGYAVVSVSSAGEKDAVVTWTGHSGVPVGSMGFHPDNNGVLTMISPDCSEVTQTTSESLTSGPKRLNGWSIDSGAHSCYVSRVNGRVVSSLGSLPSSLPSNGPNVFIGPSGPLIFSNNPTETRDDTMDGSTVLRTGANFLPTTESVWNWWLDGTWSGSSVADNDWNAIVTTSSHTVVAVKKIGGVTSMAPVTLTWTKTEARALITDAVFVPAEHTNADFHGTSQVIAVSTWPGVAYGLSSDSGARIWRYQVPGCPTAVFSCDYSIVPQGPGSSMGLLINNAEMFVGEFELDDGFFPHGRRPLNTPLSSAFPNGSGGWTGVGTDGSVSTLLNTASAESPVSWFTRQGPNTVVGFRASGKNVVAEETWRMEFGGATNENIVAVVTHHPGEIIQTAAVIQDDRNVLVKHLNPHLIGIATEGKDRVSMYLVDSVSGFVVHRTVLKGSQGPVVAAMTENMIIWQYYNTEDARFELESLSLFEPQLDWERTEFSSWSLKAAGTPGGPIVHRRSYVLPTSAREIGVTATARGITSKNFLVALSSDELWAVHSRMVDPRRPDGDKPKDGLAPYKPRLPFHPFQVLSYEHKVHGIRGVASGGSKLESTSLVLTWGTDLFFTRVMPSKTYDLLNEDFSFSTLLTTIAALVIATTAASIASSRKVSAAKWQ